MAITYIGLGQTERARDWLEKAYEVSAPGIGHQVHALLQEIRSEPRFHALIERLNLPE